MTISGFTFVRNAVRYDYPVVQSIRSQLPLVDELVVAVGNSDDGTLELIEGIGEPKIRIVHTVWDDAKRVGGHVLAEQTNIALAECRGDWCLYLQADEVLHQDDYDAYRAALRRAAQRDDVEALLLHWKHFYGTYDWLGVGRQWYRREIRAVKNLPGVTSWGDAQGFRIRDEHGVRKLRAMQADVWVYHYGWVRRPDVQQQRQRAFQAMYHDDAWVQEHVGMAEAFDYTNCDRVEPYTGTHPSVMAQRIAQAGEWAGHFDPARLRKAALHDRMLDGIERLTGKRLFEYRNYVEV